MTKQNHYCYKIILEHSDLFYTGRRSTYRDIDKDIYFGSGKWPKSIKDKTRLTKIILGVYDTKEELFAAEQAFIDEYFDDPNCMNFSRFATGGSLPGVYNHMYGNTHSEEVRQKISDSLTGKYVGVNSPNYGRKHSEEHRQKNSASKKGKYTGENHPNYGKPLSEETKQKQSIARKGKYTGENSLLYGRKYSEEHRQKMSIAAKNRPPKTEETRQKISEGNKGKQAGEKCVSAKLKEVQVRQILERYAAGGIYQVKLAKEYGVSIGTINDIIKRRTWSHI